MNWVSSIEVGDEEPGRVGGWDVAASIDMRSRERERSMGCMAFWLKCRRVYRDHSYMRPDPYVHHDRVNLGLSGLITSTSDPPLAHPC